MAEKQFSKLNASTESKAQNSRCLNNHSLAILLLINLLIVAIFTFFQNFSEILVGLAIAPWEAVSYSLLAVVSASMGLYHSFLLGTFVFTYYWGFKNLLQILSAAGSTSDGLIMLYLACGLFLLLMAIANYFAKQLRRAYICPPA